MIAQKQLGSAWNRLFETGRVLRLAWKEQRECIADVHARLVPYLAAPPDTPPEYAVHADPIPSSTYTWRKNMFSSLFHAVYLLTGVSPVRRALYGRLIHLYRIWVVSADNLLDDEDKPVVPIAMPGQSRVMRQVVALMAADRVLAELLAENAAEGIVTAQQARDLSRDSLCRLLPSAAQEASEEGGIEVRPDPEHVLNVIHRLKTGLLFNLAFAAPERVEAGPFGQDGAGLKDALMEFGLGCQLLDDVRDMARDLRERRHNYVLSWLAANRPDMLDALGASISPFSDRLYLEVREAALPAARRGFAMMRDGLARLGRAGLGCDETDAEQMARMMFEVLDIPELCIP